ncbi:MAG: hypothetical protein U1E60_00125 [Reyranellaceae bacterium]
MAGARAARAAGSRVGGAAPVELRQLLANDEDFRELIEAERQQLALPPEEWRRQRDGAKREMIKRTLVANVTDPK